MDISITIDDKEVQKKLADLSGRMTNLLPAMQEIGTLYEAAVMGNFSSESSPDGSKWKTLSPTTLMIGLHRSGGFKKNKGLSAKGKNYLQRKAILFQSGALRGSVHHQADNTGVTIGAGGSVSYAAIHQFGGRAGRGRQVNIPARPYLAVNSGSGLELSARDQKMAIDVLDRHIFSIP